MILSRSSVVGIDLGNTNTVVCIARNQKLETLVNEEGSRRTEALISFRNGQRLIGSKAKPEEVSNAANTLSYYKRFLGRRHDDPALKQETNHVAYTVQKSEQSDGVEFVVQHNDQEQIITPEHAVAMMLGKVRKLCEAEMGGQEMHDCVICCPSYWGDHERRLLIDAAKVVKLNVVRVMNETTAVAAAYGLLRPPPKEARHVMFVDMGVSATNVSVVRFVEGEVKVISTASDPHLGGRDFDLLLFDHLCETIGKQYKLDVRSSKKAVIKLKRECTRVRVVLSANSVAKYDLESFMDGKDVKGTVTRDDFEKWAAPLLARLEAPVKDALTEAKIEPSALFAVEVIGGATRMPVVQKGLSAVVGRALSFTCDSDESAARGACLQCALLSPSFKMKAFEIVDAVPYPIKLSWEKPPGGTGEMDSAVLYKRFSNFPAAREISFKGYTKPFLLTVEYDDPNKYARQLNSAAVQQPVIARFSCGGMESHVEAGDPMRMKVRVRLDMHGIVSVSSAQLLKREIVETKVDAAKAAEIAASDKAKRTADDTKCQKCDKTRKEAEVAEMLMCNECKATWCSEECRKADEKAHSAECKPDVEMKQAKTETKAETAKADTEKAEAGPAAAEGSAAEGAKAESADVDMKPAATDAPPATPSAAAEKPQVKTRLKRIELTVDTLPGSFLRTPQGGALPPETIKALVSLEAKMDEQDAVIESCVNARNQLEAYARNLHGELDYSLKPFVLESELDSLNEHVTAIEEWLDDHEEGDWKTAKSEYESKFAEAKKLGEPVYERKRAFNAREDVSQSFAAFATKVREGIADLQAQNKEKKQAEPTKAAPAAAAAVEAPKDPMAVKCEVCPKTAKDLGKRLMRCKNCYSVNYCSREHQKEHWAAHKKVCQKREAPADDASTRSTASTASTASAKEGEKKDEEPKPAASADAEPAMKPVVIHAPPQEDESQKLLDALNAAEEWLSSLKEQQSKLDMTAPPVLVPSEVETKMHSLEQQWKHLKKDLNPTKKAKKEVKPEESSNDGKEALQIEMAPSAASS